MSWLDFDVADVRVDGEMKRLLDQCKRDDAALLDDLPTFPNKYGRRGRPRKIGGGQ